MVPDESLIRLEEQVAHLSKQMDEILERTKATEAMSLILQRHEQKIEDHGKDLSGANRALVDLKGFMDSTRGGMKVLYWFTGALWAVGISILGALFYIILNMNGGIITTQQQILSLRHDFDQHVQGNNK